MSKNEQLDELFDEWKKHYEDHGINSSLFCKDGIINEIEYDRAPIKILFILRETNDYPTREMVLNNEEADLRIFLSNGPRLNIFCQLAKWAAGVLNGFFEFEDANKWEIKKTSIQSISIMNIKKFTGRKKTDFRLLNAFAFLDKKYLKEQVDIIDPEIIICCNTFTEMMWVLEIEKIKSRLNSPKIAFEKPFDYKNRKIIDWAYHPAARGSHENRYKLLREQLEGKI